MVKITAYKYFKQLFCNCGEFIICADSKLNIVYATDSVHPIFSKDDKPLINLGCIFTIRDCDRIRNSLYDYPHAISFDFISVTENIPRKCVYIPMEFDGAIYFVLNISNTKARAIEKLQQKDIETIVTGTTKKLGECFSEILQFANTLNENGKQVITSSMLKIVKLFKNIEIVTVKDCIKQQDRVLDLYRYIQKLFEKIAARLGNDNFKYTILPCESICLVNTSIDALDVMIVNIITEIYLFCKKSAHVYIHICSDKENNYIIISSDKQGMRYTPRDLFSQNEDDSHDNIVLRTVCRKVARDNDVKVFFTSTFGGGITHGLMMKRAKPRGTMLYGNLEDDPDNYKLLDTLLADI